MRPRRRCEGESEVDADSTSEADSVDAALGAGKVVDTDDEPSAGSLGSSSSSGEDSFIEKYIIAKPLKPAAPGAAATAAVGSAAAAKGATKARRSGFEPLWSDPYFCVWGHPNVDFLRAIMRDLWRQPAPAGMGTTNWSKQLTPRHYAEGADDPTRTLLLMRAWALWRARQGGWDSLQRGRSRHFQEQEALLERDVKAMGAPCRLLGCKKANSLLAAWVPELVARLRA